MKREFTPQTVNTILKEVECERQPDNTIHTCHRTPLHVDFAAGSEFQAAEEVGGFGPHYSTGDPAEFNAIGSQAKGSATIMRELHLPVIDVDGGAEVQSVRHGSKAILRTRDRGSYGPKSLLRDVLGDNGIELEVMQYPELATGMMNHITAFKGYLVGAVVLRSPKANIFKTVDSTMEGHSHIYIQQAFDAIDHVALIEELAGVGVVSPIWKELTEQAGMGIVRTPWTEKQISHRAS